MRTFLLSGGFLWLAATAAAAAEPNFVPADGAPATLPMSQPADWIGGYSEPCPEATFEDSLRGRCRRLKCRVIWRIGTCDMYQHYPYQTPGSGYYYFRPYNYTTALEQKAQIVQLGGDPRNPYSTAMFDAIYNDFRSQTPALPPVEGSVRPRGNGLPKLESLLNK